MSQSTLEEVVINTIQTLLPSFSSLCERPEAEEQIMNALFSKGKTANEAVNLTGYTRSNVDQVVHRGKERLSKLALHMIQKTLPPYDFGEEAGCLDREYILGVLDKMRQTASDQRRYSAPRKWEAEVRNWIEKDGKMPSAYQLDLSAQVREVYKLFSSLGIPLTTKREEGYEFKDRLKEHKKGMIQIIPEMDAIFGYTLQVVSAMGQSFGTFLIADRQKQYLRPKPEGITTLFSHSSEFSWLLLGHGPVDLETALDERTVGRYEYSILERKKKMIISRVCSLINPEILTGNGVPQRGLHIPHSYKCANVRPVIQRYDSRAIEKGEPVEFSLVDPKNPEQVISTAVIRKKDNSLDFSYTLQDSSHTLRSKEGHMDLVGFLRGEIKEAPFNHSSIRICHRRNGIEIISLDENQYCLGRDVEHDSLELRVNENGQQKICELWSQEENPKHLYTIQLSPTHSDKLVLRANKPAQLKPEKQEQYKPEQSQPKQPALPKPKKQSLMDYLAGRATECPVQKREVKVYRQNRTSADGKNRSGCFLVGIGISPKFYLGSEVPFDSLDIRIRDSSESKDGRNALVFYPHGADQREQTSVCELVYDQKTQRAKLVRNYDYFSTIKPSTRKPGELGLRKAIQGFFTGQIDELPDQIVSRSFQVYRKPSAPNQAMLNIGEYLMYLGSNLPYQTATLHATITLEGRFLEVLCADNDKREELICRSYYNPVCDTVRKVK